MSYRLIARFDFSVTSVEGNTTSRTVEVRAYPFPKRDPSGTIEVEGIPTPLYRTGGKGRGTVDNRYAYALVRGTPAFFGITEGEASALVGGRASLSIPVETPSVTPTETPTETPSVIPTETPTAETKTRRVRGKKEIA